MTTTREVRQALADAVATTGLECHTYARDAYAVPCAYVSRREADPRMVLQQGKQMQNFTVVLMMPRNEPEMAQEILDEYCELTGKRSVLAAVQDGDNWPDALVDYAQVTQIGALVEWRSETDGPFLSVPIDVEVVW